MLSTPPNSVRMLGSMLLLFREIYNQASMHL